ncbi:unnamed protein product [Clonostachys byssicola]|uniref:Uncharacterized protein n=1 Tax=Clonostachys byssicola TaxID=160290 RepID=A0A9N9UQ67_9HYPO|nr:unnamed protein product [Clonostachys byssicola]
MRAADALLCLCLLSVGFTAPTSFHNEKLAVIHDHSSLPIPANVDGRLDHHEPAALELRSESRCNIYADANELLDDVERTPNLRDTCFRHRLTAFAKTVILVTGEIGLAFFGLVAFLVTVTYLWPDRQVYCSVSDITTANRVSRIKRATALDLHTVHSMIPRSESRDKTIEKAI